MLSHCGTAGHRDCDATEEALSSTLYWNTRTEDIRKFVGNCIQCLSTTGRTKVPLPFGPAMHGTSPISLLQCENIGLEEGKDGEHYVLMLRDDHSGY